MSGKEFLSVGLAPRQSTFSRALFKVIFPAAAADMYNCAAAVKYRDIGNNLQHIAVLAALRLSKY